MAAALACAAAASKEIERLGGQRLLHQELAFLHISHPLRKLLGDVRHVGAHELQVAAHHRIEGGERGGARFRRGALAQIEFHRFQELVAELAPQELIQALRDLAKAVFGITFR
jgi:hypothetical protein